MEQLSAEEIWDQLINREDYSAKIQIPPEVVWQLFKHHLGAARMIINGKECFVRQEEIERLLKPKCEYFALWGNEICIETGFCILFQIYDGQEALLQCPLKRVKEFTNHILTASGLKRFYIDAPKASDRIH